MITAVARQSGDAGASLSGPARHLDITVGMAHGGCGRTRQK